jgi:DNA-binding NarL/FixJ family response regulator
MVAAPHSPGATRASTLDAQQPSGFAAEPRRWRLMIADDDEATRTFLSVALQGFDVISAGDSEEAIELARAAQPDAALLDVQMPKGGGLRAVRGILEAAPETAIVMLSMDESDATVRELLAAGAIAYCRKGTAPDALCRSIVQAIELRAAERAAASGSPSG